MNHVSYLLFEIFMARLSHTLFHNIPKGKHRLEHLSLPEQIID